MAENKKNLNYIAPEWGCLPMHDFKIVVYEKGREVDSHVLKEKQFFTIGRDTKADILISHHSASRFHCVAQFNNNGGLYLFDLGATNRTFLNRKAIKPRQFAKMNVGNFFQIGTSDRFYFLEGPESLMPPEIEEPLDYATEEKPDGDTTKSQKAEINLKLSKIEVLKQYDPVEVLNASGESVNNDDSGAFCNWFLEILY